MSEAGAVQLLFVQTSASLLKLPVSVLVTECLNLQCSSMQSSKKLSKKANGGAPYLSKYAKAEINLNHLISSLAPVTAFPEKDGHITELNLSFFSRVSDRIEARVSDKILGITLINESRVKVEKITVMKKIGYGNRNAKHYCLQKYIWWLYGECNLSSTYQRMKKNVIFLLRLNSFWTIWNSITLLDLSSRVWYLCNNRFSKHFEQQNILWQSL